MPQSDQSLLMRSNVCNDHVGKKQKIKTKFHSKIYCDCNKVDDLLNEKVNQRCEVCDTSKVIMFDSFDGVNHLESVKENQT